MSQCSSCGASVRPEKKFCGVCGAARVAAAPTAFRCRQCGLEASGTAKYCKSCGGLIGGSPRDDSAGEQSARGPVVWGAVAAGLIVCVLAISAYWMWPRTSVSATGPAEEAIGSLVAARLPSVAQLQTISLQAVEPYVAEGAQGYRARFIGSGLVTSTLYVQTGVEDEYVLLREAAAQGSLVPLTGDAILKPNGAGGWTGNVSLEPSLLDTAKPRDAFAGQQTLVEGSAEHLALRDAKAANEVKEAQARAAAQERTNHRLVEEQQARERAAEEARAAQARLVAQQTQAAAAAAARADAERQQHLQQLAEAREREEAARQEAEALRAREAKVGSGRVPKGKEVTVRLQTALRSDTVAVEDRFMVTTVEDVVVDGRVLVPAGATLRGAVAAVQAAGRANRTARLDLRFDLLSVGSRSFPMRGRAEVKGSGLKGDAKKVGIGAGIGAVVGGILGGAKGAAIGGAAGGGGTLAATEGQEIDLPAGAQLRIKFDSPVDLP